MDNVIWAEVKGERLLLPSPTGENGRDELGELSDYLG